MGEIMGLVRNGVRIRLLAAVAISALAIASLASAQDGQRQDYNVEAGDLGAALRTVSRLSGREIIFGAEAVKGKHAPRLRGTYSADEAVRALLEGSDLTAEFRKDVILIRGRSEASGEIADRPAEEGDIIVTGSHIRGGHATSPVIEATRTAIENQGLNDLASFARSIPQNFSGGQNPGVIGSEGGSENVNSSSTLNLRGLGADATLTLVNGHRVAYDAAAQGVDISSIPLVAVERVEIVADGSSALYGSDAVGGVANIILRRDFDGLEASAHFGAATDGGYVQQQYSVVSGDRWASGGFVAALDFNRSTDITSNQRSYTTSLDDSATLFPALKQYSAVLAGHQNLTGDIEFEFDGQFSDRASSVSSPFFVTSDVRTNGTRTDQKVTQFSLTPRLRFKLPRRWELTLTATHGNSDTDVGVSSYFQGNAVAQSKVTYENRLDAIELGAEGPLFPTPGGEARLAIGGGFRSIHLYGNIRTTFGGVTGSTSQDFTAKRDAYFAYGELSLPIVGPKNERPLLHRLILTGATRYEAYGGVAGVATPKLGIVYDPTSDISIKATWGKSFKAPTLYQEFSARQAFLVPGDIFQAVAPGFGTVLVLGGSGADLKPERATTWTTTVVVRPRFLEGLRLEASYFDLKYKQRIVAPINDLLRAFSSEAYSDLRTLNPTAQQVLSAIAGVPAGLTNQTGELFDPAGVGAILDNRFQNAARQSLRGVDLAASYGIDLDASDRLELTGVASYLESDQQLSPGQPTLQRAGTLRDSPHWRGRGAATWSRDNFSLTGVASYIGGTLDDRFEPFVRVGSFTSIDAVARVKTRSASGPLSGIEATISVLNLFNEKPAIVRTTNPATPPYDSANYSSIGRVISFTLTKAW
ncbi:TonB-dependent receptor domain-containing protein [Novosphingobium percolationis]|uniref:TonB-dependent receptor domain-containing protein n=1 Tax=Novosphingobium percolationis TaxID=2871811 RepID=UPI001CD249CE|nr:TonB-dependent receptor [Novosphingobium percolationis]